VTVRNALDVAFERAREQRRGALILYLTAGHPERSGFVDLAVAVLEAGADALEIGIPFSDPLLDGVVIQRSQQIALDGGITPADCIRFAAEIHERVPQPLLLMGAYNPILAYGQEDLCREASQAGVTGFIVPDLPYEEQGDLLNPAHRDGLHVIQMAAPTSPGARLAEVCAAASGFLYCISVAGVTGTRASVATTARPLVERVRACTSVPVAVGFGIARPEQAAEVAGFADGAIVGSALVNLVADAPPDEREVRAREFVSAMRKALGAAAAPR
jgi:tryptophan synthase alpha chain